MSETSVSQQNFLQKKKGTYTMSVSVGSIPFFLILLFYNPFHLLLLNPRTQCYRYHHYTQQLPD